MDSGATTSRRWMRASCQSVPTMAMVVSVFPRAHFHEQRRSAAGSQTLEREGGGLALV